MFPRLNIKLIQSKSASYIISCMTCKLPFLVDTFYYDMSFVTLKFQDGYPFWTIYTPSNLKKSEKF